MSVLKEGKEYIPKPKKGWHLRGMYKPLFLFEKAIKKVGFAGPALSAY